MSDNRPNPPDRKFALVAPIVVGLAAVVVLVLVLARPEPAPTAKPQAPPQPAPPVVATPPAPAPVAILGRAEMLEAARAAADAYARGDDVHGAKDLVGRRFAMRLAFGCAGPLADPGPAQAYYQYDAKAPSLRLVARPAIWTDLPLVRAATAAGRFDSVEGFWVTRPWLTDATCPHRRDIAPPATPTPVEAPSLGLAMFHAADASRVERRDERAYEHVIKLGAGETGAGRAFDLVLEGRIAGLADGAAIRCWAESAEHRPTCLYAVAFDRVAFEDAGGGLLAEWPR